jgi:L-lactate utilization protein LutB
VENIEIFDIYGKKHHISYLTSQISNHQINIAHLPAGVYFVKVYTEAGEVVKKVVKM